MIFAKDVLQIAWAKQAEPSLFLFNPPFMQVRAMLTHIEYATKLAFATHPSEPDCPSQGSRYKVRA